MRLKRRGVYKVERVAACRVHPAAGGGLEVRLTLEVSSVGGPAPEPACSLVACLREICQRLSGQEMCTVAYGLLAVP